MIKWFGPNWGAPCCTPDNHVQTPAAARCAECHQHIGYTNNAGFLIPYTGMPIDESEVTIVRAEIPYPYLAYHRLCFINLILPPALLAPE